ncbi:hypothetical protein Acor_24830 [Acrocarpospora corrugata]|uniref:Uncharacterized protein n=1 Tax=Acrocarpospora corrugata TaxID=35763 RepID=A0A5M3VW53_9ACTN|nr:hypothetical protein [Acrocarpospora corrugata]GES00419.1 hypothetical protein Acor_24830 [Acrocarpospora corrugata]
MVEIAEMAALVVPYITAAVGAYGAAVWTKTQELAAEETAGWGRRMLQRLAGRPESRPALESAVADVEADANDGDAVAALRMQVKKALAADPELAAEIATMLAAASPVTAGAGSQVISGSHIVGDVNQIGSARDVSITGRGGVSVRGNNSGIVSTGDGARNVQMNAEASGQGRVYQAGGDQTVNE